MKALIGNHEEMMEYYYRRGDWTWLMHDGEETMRSFRRTFASEAARRQHMEWTLSLPLVVEDDEFVYMHAGLNPNRPLHDQERDNLLMEEGEIYAWPRETLLRLIGANLSFTGTRRWSGSTSTARMNCDLGSNTYPVVEERRSGRS